MKQAVCWIVGLLLWSLSGALLGPPAQAVDWPQWGGPQRDLVWREEGIVDQLPTGELPRIWTAPVAAGYAGPAVAAGRVFVTDRVTEQHTEGVHCFDSQNGQPLWDHSYPAASSISYPLGPRATPTVDGDHAYTLGAMGHLFCLATASGEVVWQRELFICNEQGELILAKLSRDGYQDIGRSQLIEPTQGIKRRMTVWSHLAFAEQSVFARNDEELIRVNLAAP